MYHGQRTVASKTKFKVISLKYYKGNKYNKKEISIIQKDFYNGANWSSDQQLVHSKLNYLKPPNKHELFVVTSFKPMLLIYFQKNEYKIKIIKISKKIYIQHNPTNL